MPLRVERAILRCLAKSPEERFGDALDVFTALEPPRRRWPFAAAAALLLAVLGAVGGYQWRKSHAMSREPTVAVVGFRNESGDPNYDWLATELAETLTTEMSGSKGIHAVPGDEVSSIKTELSVAQNQSLEHEDLSSVREALGANYLLLGRYAVVPQDSTLDVNVLLQDSEGNTAANIHAAGKEGDYRNLITSVAAQVRQKLGTNRLSDIQASQLQNLYPADAQASQLYFQGLDKLRSFDTTAALPLLQRASERDPNNVSIHWALADAWAQLKHDPEAAAEAQKAAALAGNASLPQEYVVLAQGRAAEMSKQWEAAIDAYKSLFRLFPQHLSYGLRLAAAQIEGSHAADALSTLDSLAKLPAPMGTDPRIAMMRAKAYFAMNDYASELRFAQVGLDEAKKRNARMMQARAQLELCWAHRNLGHVDEAYSACNEAQNLFSAFGDNVSAAVALNDVATWLFDRSRYSEAKQLYDRVIQANKAAGAQKDLAGAYVNAARTLARMGKGEDAEDYIAKALSVAGPIGDKYDEALARIQRGVVLSEQGRLSEAENEEEQALQLSREIKNDFLQATALGNLAEYQSETDSRLALATYSEALRLVQRSGDQSGTATCLTNMGDVFFRRGELGEAEKNYQAALRIDTQLKDKDALAHDWLALAEVDLERGKLADAEAKALQSVNAFHEDQDSDSESEATSLLVRVLLAEKKTAEAGPYVNRLQTIVTGDREAQFDSRLSVAEYLNAMGKPEDAVGQLMPVPKEAKSAGMNFVSLKSRLALLKLQLSLKPPPDAAQELASIRAAARSAGFTLLTQEAAAIHP